MSSIDEAKRAPAGVTPAKWQPGQPFSSRIKGEAIEYMVSGVGWTAVYPVKNGDGSIGLMPLELGSDSAISATWLADDFEAPLPDALLAAFEGRE